MGAMGAMAPTNFEKGVFGTHVVPTKIKQTLYIGTQVFKFLTHPLDNITFLLNEC